MSHYFPRSFKSFGGEINVKVNLSREIKVKVDLSNYGTKTDLKNVAHVNTSSFALKTNLAILKTEVNEWDIDNLAPVPDDWNKLSDVVKMMLLKKLCYNYDKVDAKVNNIDTSDFVKN